MSFTATARPLAGTLRHEIDVNGRHTIITDEPSELGGTDSAPAPHELLAAMLASCVSTMVALYARRHDWALEGMHVDVEYETDTTPRHLAVQLHLPESLTDEQVDRLRRVADTCPVRRAFEAGFEFDEQVTIDASPQVATERSSPRRAPLDQRGSAGIRFTALGGRSAARTLPQRRRTACI